MINNVFTSQIFKNKRSTFFFLRQRPTFASLQLPTFGMTAVKAGSAQSGSPVCWSLHDFIGGSGVTLLHQIYYTKPELVLHDYL